MKMYRSNRLHPECKYGVALRDILLAHKATIRKIDRAISL
jgi:hypothetical protein